MTAPQPPVRAAPPRRREAPERILTNAEARRLFLARHRLSERPTGPADRATVAATIRDLGFVQVDSIATVARAHHTILYARHHRYRPATLRRLLDTRDLFEGWTHDASLIPIEFWPHWRRRHASFAEHARTKWAGRFGPDIEAVCARVLAHIEANGPTMTRHFEEERTQGGWWEWHPTKVALEYLWRSGRIAVCHREAFQKCYDLTERVVPAPILQREVSDEETVDWACEAALSRLGFATPKQIAAFFELVATCDVEAWRARQGDRLITIGVTQADGAVRPMLAFADALEHADPPAARLRILSPFDPLLRDRRRTELLFGFHYRIEVFVPAPKRRYGYYVFPMLEGERFVGRIDMARSGDALEVTALWPEAGVRFGTGRCRALDAELHRMARFAECERVQYRDGWLRK